MLFISSKELDPPNQFYNLLFLDDRKGTDHPGNTSVQGRGSYYHKQGIWNVRINQSLQVIQGI